MTIHYDKLLSHTESFEQDISSFFSHPQAVGCNVTAPFKEQAFQLATKHDLSSELAKASNTLYLDEHNKLVAANTDGVGLVSDIKRNIGSLHQLRVILLGAGGAARGVIHPLLEEGVGSLTIANRTFEKAESLATEVNAENVAALRLEDCTEAFDVVINATSAGLTGQLPNFGALSFDSVLLTYDMVYKKHPTDFLIHAQGHGSDKVCDGLGMLVGQAAKSFEIWTGFTPSVEALITQLREQM